MASDVNELDGTGLGGRGQLALLVRALRPLHWTKNLLVFVPALMAHQIDGPTLLAASIAFVCLSLCASATYLVNDMADAESDRAHPRKRERPFATRRLSRRVGSVAAGFLLMVGLLVATTLPNEFWLLALGYVLVTMAYSAGLKRIVLLDVLILGGLYVLRVVSGGAATDIPLSPWFLAFAMFFFLGLAFLKRYAELQLNCRLNIGQPGRRGYRAADADILVSVGPVSGYISVLVMALYINSDGVAELYSRPLLLWLIGPLLIYWITRLWILARRGELHDDPLIFTATDATSYVVAATISALLLISAGLPR